MVGLRRERRSGGGILSSVGGDQPNKINLIVVVVLLLALLELVCNWKRMVGAYIDLYIPKNKERAKWKGHYINLPIPNSTKTAISTGACCGIGHRMTLNLASMIYGISNERLVYVNWDDIKWNTLFNDTDQIKQGNGTVEKDHYGNCYPIEWNEAPLAKAGPRKQPNDSSSYDQYSDNEMKAIFDMPLAQSIMKSLSDNLSLLVLSFLDPMRDQYASSSIHMCAHVRQGNNESGDWEEKEWRHIDFNYVLNSTLAGMKHYYAAVVEGKNDSSSRSLFPDKVSVFVASDNEMTMPWFEEHIPTNWHMVKPAKLLPRPESGVWFGQHGSTTNQNLTQDQKDEAMAEAVADVFALGECDALFIPNYSSFSLIGITLTRAEKNGVFFLGTNGSYLVMPPAEAVNFS
jgi:hypothetical protein